MKKSRHVVAQLREVLGMSQPGFASLIGCSPATIQSIELNNGRLNLSRKLSERICAETGVDISWLLKNDPTDPLLNEAGKPYTHADYERYQASLKGIPEGDFERVQAILLQVLAGVKELLLSAQLQNKTGLLQYKLFTALKKWNDEFKLNSAGSCISEDNVPAELREKIRNFTAEDVRTFSHLYNSLVYEWARALSEIYGKEEVVLKSHDKTPLELRFRRGSRRKRTTSV